MGEKKRTGKRKVSKRGGERDGTGRDGTGRTPHMHLQLVEWNLLLAVRTQCHGAGGGALRGRLRARHVVVSDAQRLARREGGFGGGLRGLGAVAGFGAFGDLVGFVRGVGVVGGVWGWVLVVEVHFHGRYGGLGCGVEGWEGWWVHGVLLLLLGWLLGGVGVVVGVFVCRHGFFDPHVVWLEGHHSFLLERGGLQVVEGGGAGEVGLIVGFGEEDCFDNDEIVPVDLCIFDCFSRRSKLVYIRYIHKCRFTVFFLGSFFLLVLLLLLESDPFGSLLRPSEDVESVLGVGL